MENKGIEKPVDRGMYSLLKDDVIQCRICPTQCIIKPGKQGFCRTKQNKDGVLITPDYGAVCYLGLDFIERTPMFHFWPGTNTLAIACPSCNFTCAWCVNWAMSQNTAGKLPDIVYPSIELILEKAEEWDCKSITYTYTEPTIWYDFALEIAKVAHERGLLNVLKSNGYMSLQCVDKLAPYIDAASIDIKGFSDEFYQKECCGRLKPVLDTIRRFKELGKHVEICNMILPGVNDDINMIRDLAAWVASTLGPDTPLIFQRFFPHGTYIVRSSTPTDTLEDARRVAMKEGLHYVYIWGFGFDEAEGLNTYCPECKKELVHRQYF